MDETYTLILRNNKTGNRAAKDITIDWIDLIETIGQPENLDVPGELFYELLEKLREKDKE